MGVDRSARSPLSRRSISVRRPKTVARLGSVAIRVWPEANEFQVRYVFLSSYVYPMLMCALTICRPCAFALLGILFVGNNSNKSILDL